MHLEGLVNYLHLHPHICWLFAFIVSFAESLAVIGTIVPGSITMTAIGVLIGSGALPATLTLISAVVGAFAGDLFSYWVGSHYNERLKNIWPFKRYPNWLAYGETFFKKHGIKSVIIGRFIGPARSAVPLVAGLLHMRWTHFVVAAIPSACLWAITYILSGILIGAVSMELPPGTASKFIIGIFVLIVVGSILAWLIQNSLKRMLKFFHHRMEVLWGGLERLSVLRFIPRWLQASHATPAYHLLSLLCLIALGGILFLVLWYGVAKHNWVTVLNQPTYYVLLTLRHHFSDNFMTDLTLFADKTPLTITGILMVLFFALQRQWRYAGSWFFITLVSIAAIGGFKHVFFNARPPGLVYQDPSSSFPSGHVTFMTSVSLFVAYLSTHFASSIYRKIAYSLALLMIILTALSRLYLGAHWLTDVISAFILGSMIMMMTVILLERKPARKKIKVKLFLPYFLVVWLISGFVFTATHFKQTRHNSTPLWETGVLSDEGWWKGEQNLVPLFALSRFGKPKQAFNIQWLGSLEDIETTLINKGWQENSNKKFLLMFLPTLYQNGKPSLYLFKNDSTGNYTFILELWDSNIKIINSPFMLWIGTLAYYSNSEHKLNLTDSPSFFYDHSIDSQLVPRGKFETTTIDRSDELSLKEIERLGWDGKVLLLRQLSK